jgi:DNA polymerase III delta subunit
MKKIDPAALDRVVGEIEQGRSGPLYLVTGDRVLAEPAGLRIAQALADSAGCGVEVHKRPAELGPILADLKTYSLFAAAKVVLAVETAVMADSDAAAHLIDEALEACPVRAAGGSDLSERERRSANRLLQTVRLFQLDPDVGSSAELVGQLPSWVLGGGKTAGRRPRRRGRRQVEEAREQLATLLDAAREAGLQGWAESELGELAELAKRGLPDGHALVLAESAVAERHPLIETLSEGRCLVALGRVEAAKGGGWQGLSMLAEELERETGIAIDPDALEELARRTLQLQAASRGDAAVDGDSTVRLAAEYRKLAMLAADGHIDLQLVETVVEDRGEEDVWKTLDAIGEGRPEEALRRVRRLLAAADDPLTARLSFFALLAGFARQLTAVSDLVQKAGAARREVPYPVFKEQLAPRLQAELSDHRRNPVAGLHPYRLYRIYSVACRIPAARIADLPSRVLATEVRLKGDSGQPDAALMAFVCDLATAAGPSR